MSTSIRKKPWLATASIAAAIVVGLLVVPFSYERVQGHDVTLTLSGIADPEIAKGIAQEFKTALGAENGARLKGIVEDGVPSFVLEASVPGRSGTVRVDAFGKALVSRGYAATWSAAPRSERVWGSVVAYARDRVIQVSVDGKSAQQLEAEITQRLVEAGIQNPQVSVTDDGDKQTIKITAERQQPMGEVDAGELDVQLTKNGLPIRGEDGCDIQVRRLKDDSGAERMRVKVSSDGRSASIEIPNAAGMSDAALAAEINAGVMQAGMLDVIVEVNNGELGVRKR